MVHYQMDDRNGGSVGKGSTTMFELGFCGTYKNVGFTNRACSNPDKIVVRFTHTIYPYLYFKISILNL